MIRRLLVAAALTFVTVPLAAQIPDSTRRDSIPVVELAPLEVTGSIAPIAGPKVGSGIPARISTITREELEGWEPRTLADALTSQPGVSLYDDVGAPGKVSLSTRGFSAGPVLGLPQGVSVFLDGVRQNEPDAAEVNFDLLPLEHVRRIELLSGTASLLGPNSLGGAINLVSKRGGGPTAGELEASGGSFGQASGEGSLSGAAGRWDYYLGSGYDRDDGWRDGTGSHGGNVFLNVGRQAARGGIGLQSFYATSYAETAGSLPQALFDSSPESNFTTGDFEDLSQFQLSLTGYHAIGTNGRGSATLYHRRSDAERFNVNQAPDPDVRGFSANRTVGANLDYRLATTLGGRTLALRFGADGTVNRVHVRLYEESPGTRTLTTSVKSPGWDVSSYALADLTLGRATISGGARFDYIRIPFRDLLDPSADTTSSFSRLSPRGGISVDLGRGASAYGSLGRSFRAPALLELTCADATAPCPLPFALGDDPPLDPVIATTVEVGGRWVTGPAILDASLYRTAVTDDIFFISSDTASFRGYFENIGRTRREGVELSARLVLSGGNSVYANYAFTRATFQTTAALFSAREATGADNTVHPGDELPLVPRHQVRAGAVLRLGTGVTAGADARYVGRQWLRGDEANDTPRLPAYFTADLRLGWNVGPWQVSGIVSNVWNHSYAVFGTFNQNRNTGNIERFLTPGAPRALKVVLRREFGAGEGE